MRNATLYYTIECFDPADVNPHRTMDAEMTEVCGYLAADPDKSDIVDAFETKNWFIKIGESLDNDDVERQLALHCHTDKETVNEMSLEHFKIMVKGYSGAVQILED